MGTKNTLLERYWTLRGRYEAGAKETVPSPAQLWVYQELVYRIGVLEVFSRFIKAAPVTSDMKALVPHYQVANGYIEHLKNEGFHPSEVMAVYSHSVNSRIFPCSASNFSMSRRIKYRI